MGKRIFEVILVLAGTAVVMLWITGYGHRRDPEPQPASTPDLHQRWKAAYFSAMRQLDYGSLQTAERDLHDALKLARQLPQPASEVAETLDDLGQVCYRRGKPEEAAKWQAEAVDVARQCHGPDSPTVALYLTRLAMVQDKQGALGSLAEAERIYAKAGMESEAHAVEHQRSQLEAPR